ncbi:glycerate kinase [Micromonospora sp. WMMD736]|uniref:glycerate kinase n=1 Tax=Micromonospora sp. WMMD736 TaxID=3404112 RepID=UPI003B95352A
MTVLIAPDSFKGTYTAAEVATAILAGVEAAGGTGITMPVADGGEGTLAALQDPLGLTVVSAPTVNPWGADMDGRYGYSADGTALIEVAEASGITTPHAGPRDPVTADTYGTGLLIADAYRRGARNIVLAAGGSATTDGGAGAVRALQEAEVTDASFTILTDVTTLFLDAAKVFGPQKGADPATVELLTARLSELADSYSRDPIDVPGSGAAGGFVGGMWAEFDARIVSGADFVLDTCGFDDAVQQASAIVVGEGRLDSQTAAGKIISVILRRSAGVPVYAVVGSVTDCDRSAFADVIVASDAAAMEAAGRAIASR